MVAKRRTTITSQTVRANLTSVSKISKIRTGSKKGLQSDPDIIPAKVTDIVSVLENSEKANGISVGHIVEAKPVLIEDSEETIDFILGEVMAIRQINDEAYFYIHFLNEASKLDDWLPYSHIRPIPTELLESRIRETMKDVKFFNLSIFSATASAVYPRHNIKSIKGVQIGNTAVLRAWYPSPYPEMISCPNSYIKICDMCLSYFKSSDELNRHWSYCAFNHPPGTEIYRKDDHSVFEIDGEVHNGYCERLLLLAKLFLEEKRACGRDASQYAQVRTFHFYVLCRWRSSADGRAEIVGYFSKLKNSNRESNILSCILVLPHEQRKGYGNFLIDLSYELGRIEGRIGSAERPLSELGQLSFYPYWMRKISPVIRDIPQEIHSVIVSEISLRTGITCEDIVETLKHYGLIKEWGTAGVVVLGTSQIVDSWCSSERKNNKTLFDANRLKWTPIFDFRNGTFPNASAAAAGG
jgi:histone acetyltransferase HTATIP